MAVDLETAWLRLSSPDARALFTPPAGLAAPVAPRATPMPSPTLPVAAELTAPPAPRRRRAPWIIVGAFAAGAVGTAVYLAITGMTPQVAPNTAVATPRPLDAALVQVALDAPVPVDAPLPVVTPLPDKIELRVKSTPPNADVIRAADGVRIGKTPFARQFDRIDGEIELIVKLSGYKDARLVLSTAKDGERAVQLVRLRAGTHPPDDRRGSNTKPAGSGSGATVLDPYEDK